MHLPTPLFTRPSTSALTSALLLALVLVLALPLAAQTTVKLSPSPSLTTYTEVDGSGNTVYVCRTPALGQFRYTFSTAATNLTNIVVSSNTATVTFPANHGFLPGYKLVISGSATSALNGTYRVVTADPATTTLTFTTSGVSNGTYTDASIFTDAPLLTKPIWAINYNVYSGTNLVASLWSNGDVEGYNQICANRAAVNGATVVTYK